MSAGHLSAHTYPLEAWRITETGFDLATHFLDETLFALGNGYIGLRGTHEEGFSGPANASLDGTYLNGFHEWEPIQYPENAYGLARRNEFMLNVPNGKRIELWIGDERFDLAQGVILNYRRFVDFRHGVATRVLEWESPKRQRVAITSERIVPLRHKHLFALRYQVKPINFAGQIRLVSALDGAVKNVEAGDDPRVGSAVSGPALHLVDAKQADDFSALVHRTRNSGFTLVSAIDSTVAHAGAVTRTQARHGQCVQQQYDVFAGEAQTVTLTKFGAYFSSRDYPEHELLERARNELAKAKALGFDALCAEQHAALSEFWRRADVEIAGDDALQQGIRFNQFHLLQSVGRDGKTNIAAKGITGEGYEGHTFWDTEIYILPFFLYNQPEIAKKLLEYRHHGLPKARERARQMAHAKGALFPWRTIAGEECSSYFPAGTAQYHINADIAYAVKLYVETTGDDAFLLSHGAEIVLDTARIWMGLGHFESGSFGERFRIDGVTGPDEYTAIVNNNYYTNAMAQLHLEYAADVAERLRRDHPGAFHRLADTLALDADEPEQWRRAARRMYLPYDRERGIHPQDDSFLCKKPWDFAGTPKDKYPLLLHYHPLVIYRHQVCKQADVVLAMLLLGDRVPLEDKRRNFDFYEAVTTHDSSLSTCIFSILASEVGYADKAYDYFMETARLDLDDTHGNTCHGVHTAAMAGTWLCVAYGFAGMRMHGGEPSFAPTLPRRWTHYQFKVHVRGRLLQVRVGGGEVEYRLLEGEPLALRHRGRPIQLATAATVALHDEAIHG
ncbi:MAG TPA: glycosyl hydrolase family 65 protein [Paucimonas sp.]|nr:glycosyl hydrolase family 65 protein [Paucimonas sp.]